MKNSFESSALEHADLDKAHKKALEAMETSRFKEEDFLQPYGPETIQRDLDQVKKREADFEAGDPLGEIFEAVVLEHGELSNWFGDNAFTTKTSKYDDYENKVDLVVEFRESPTSASHLGLAADVTFSPNSEEKFAGIRRHIDKGVLGKVKYFHSEHMNIHGQLSKLPEVVIGADRNTVKELSELWLEKDNKMLGNHRIQIMILTQIKEQLETYAMYANSIGQSEAENIYASRITIVDRILEEKRKLVENTRYEINDYVHTGIMEYLKNWKKGIEGK